MNSIVTLTEVQQSAYQVLTLQSSVDQKINEAIKRLAIILIRYENWNDYLSLRICDWILDVLPYDSQQNVDETVYKLALVQIQELRKILSDPITKAFFKEPVLDRKWEWEKSVLEDYQKLAQIFSPKEAHLSPFDALPTEIKTHEFAMEMLEWIKSLSINNKEQDNENSVVTTIQLSVSNKLFPSLNLKDQTIDGQNIQFRIMFKLYRTAAQKIAIDRRLSELNQDILETISENTAQLKIRHEEFLHMLEESRMKEMENEEKRKIELESLVKINHDLQERLNKEQHSKIEKDELAKMAQRLMERCANLEYQLQNMPKNRKKCIIM